MIIPTPDDWIIRIPVDVLLTIAFVLVLLPSLWKLTLSRPGLIIVFSRAAGNFCRILSDLSAFLVIYILQMWTKRLPPAFLYTLNNGMGRAVTVMQHTHNLALALNRAHAMFFPFHYNFFYSKKSKLLLICLFLWLFAISVAASDQTLIIYPTPTVWLTNFCMCASGLVYVALGCRMLWMKYKNKSMAAISTEKDSVKILIVCFACLAMSVIYLAMQRMQILPFMSKSSYIVEQIFVWLYYCSNLLSLCTEEISLCLLVRDFRTHLKQQLRAIFGCFYKNNTTPTLITMGQNGQQPKANAIVVVNSNAVRVANCLASNQRQLGQ